MLARSGIVAHLPGDDDWPHGYYELDDGRKLPLPPPPEGEIALKWRATLQRVKRYAPEPAARWRAMFLRSRPLESEEFEPVLIGYALRLLDETESAAGRRLGALILFSVWCRRHGIQLRDAEMLERDFYQKIMQGRKKLTHKDKRSSNPKTRAKDALVAKSRREEEPKRPSGGVVVSGD